ncbi:MAG: folylpolyglutamate synthase/dihydrofolate synthase family protein [Chloroflexota bacterium]|nr:folylpolyglutamate synthase/dihydrofolate synthase family protein [Chloroflexota bacterium]
MNYTEAINYLLSLLDHERTEPRIPRQKRIYNLDCMQTLLRSMGNPQEAIETIHVAGTKGKGSTAAMCNSILGQAGYSTGFYSSPHLHTFRERVRLGGQLIPEVEFAQLVRRIKPYCDAITELGTIGPVSLFEFMTAMAFSYFADQEVDFQVVEVGLGGRLDATNVVNPAVALITSVSLDHTSILGDSLEEIAYEKGGIIKSGTPAVISPQDNRVMNVLQGICSANSTEAIVVGEDVTYEFLGRTNDGQRALINGRLGEYEVILSLLGSHQLENAATALAGIEVLIDNGADISVSAISNGFKNVSWPCRMEIISQSPTLILDGAHNPYSVSRVLSEVRANFTYNNCVVIVGFSRDKNVEDMVNIIAEIEPRVVVTESRHPRSLDSNKLYDHFVDSGLNEVKRTDDVDTALKIAKTWAGSDDLILIIGSLFVAAEGREEVLGIIPEIYPDLLSGSQI